MPPKALSTIEKTDNKERPQKEVTLPAKIVGSLWAGLALLTILTYWQDPIFFNLASSFRFQLLIVLTVLSFVPVVLFPGPRRWVFLAVPAMISVTFLSYFIAPEANHNLQGPELKVAVVNVYSGNRDLSRLGSWLEKEPVQVLGVLEVAPHHLDALKTLGFPYLTAEPQNGNFGIALLFQEEPVSVQTLDSDTQFPSILAEFQDYRVLLTHPVPPLSLEARKIGDEQVQRLAKLIAQSEKPTIVMGDFNSTGWDARSYPLEEVGLREARQGFGIVPTWPVGRALMQIPIDHILIPEAWGVSKLARGPEIGSDHYPLRAELHRR